MPIPVTPVDRHNRQLISSVHPPDWVNPQPADVYDLVVIGAGTAGLVVAAGAAGLGLGLKVALVERHLMGGDCLNFGCVPSKTSFDPVESSAKFGAVGSWELVLGKSRSILGW
jgi:glycine/D-amino acid oxidase-like deaminating enzyme